MLKLRGLWSGLDSPGLTHGHDSLVPACPKAVPGVPQHFALQASTLYYFAGANPLQNPSLLDHCMGYPWQTSKACPALVVVPIDFDMCRGHG